MPAANPKLELTGPGPHSLGNVEAVSVEEANCVITISLQVPAGSSEAATTTITVMIHYLLAVEMFRELERTVELARYNWENFVRAN